jgi:hypothetical protein
MSQTCRLLRQAFLPLFWKELTIGMGVLRASKEGKDERSRTRRWEKTLVRELVCRVAMISSTGLDGSMTQSVRYASAFLSST